LLVTRAGHDDLRRHRVHALQPSICRATSVVRSPFWKTRNPPPSLTFSPGAFVRCLSAHDSRSSHENITLSADEQLIEAARARARAAHTTLNEEFRRWLAAYGRPQDNLQRYEDTMAALRGQLTVGPKLTPDQMNER